MFFQETKLFASGGSANYRIPSLIVTNNGTVLAFCTNRIGTLKDHADEADLVCAVKKPGEAWGDVRVPTRPFTCKNTAEIKENLPFRS